MSWLYYVKQNFNQNFFYSKSMSMPKFISNIANNKNLETIDNLCEDHAKPPKA